MIDFQFLVTVTAESMDEAERVMCERIEPDEDYGFEYVISWGAQPEATAPIESDAAHVNDWIVVVAWSDPYGLDDSNVVGVGATLGGDQSGDRRHYLVPGAEYWARNGRFVIDEARHMRCADFTEDFTAVVS